MAGGLRGIADGFNLYACALAGALTTADPRRIQETIAPVSAASV
jgi:hypothetical protein